MTDIVERAEDIIAVLTERAHDGDSLARDAVDLIYSLRAEIEAANQRVMSLRGIALAVISDTREKCAQVAEDMAKNADDPVDLGEMTDGIRVASERIAAAIRALPSPRSETINVVEAS